MKIIGLAGRAGSGKTTAAQHLEMFGFKRFGFSDTIKDFAMEYFNETRKNAYCIKPASTRTILQGIGSMIREQIEPLYFINALDNKLQKITGLYPCFVIDDLRLPEEAFYVLDRGGIIIKLECPDAKTILSKEHELHNTEISVDVCPFTHVISANYGEVEKIKHEVERIAHNYIHAG